VAHILCNWKNEGQKIKQEKEKEEKRKKERKRS